jgi:hypothetical protein
MAMCLGAVRLNLLIWGGAALLGHTDVTQRFPELAALVIALTLSMPMAAWMGSACMAGTTQLRCPVQRSSWGSC